jgi:hypothetical protein
MREWENEGKRMSDESRSGYRFMRWREENQLHFANNQYFVIRKFHPSKIVDIKVEFSHVVFNTMGMVLEVELFFVEQQAVDFDLGFVFTHDLQEDASIPMQNLIDFLNAWVGHFP